MVFFFLSQINTFIYRDTINNKPKEKIYAMKIQFTIITLKRCICIFVRNSKRLGSRSNLKKANRISVHQFVVHFDNIVHTLNPLFQFVSAFVPCSSIEFCRAELVGERASKIKESYFFCVD